MISDLKVHIPDYEKGDADTYRIIKERLPAAITNAKQVALHCTTGGTDTPSTELYKVVEYLQKLKNG